MALRVGLIGQEAERRGWREAAASVPEVVLLPSQIALPAVLDAAAEADLAAVMQQVDAIGVAGPTAQHYRIAEIATQWGVHVYLGWPPATSVRECAAIGRLAEEASVEVGVHLTGRQHPILTRLPRDSRPRLITLHQTVPTGTAWRWQADLAHTVDLCSALARSHSVQRIDAEAVRGTGGQPVALAFSLRYHNGIFAQVSLRQGRTADSRLYVAGPQFQWVSTLLGDEIITLTPHRKEYEVSQLQRASPTQQQGFLGFLQAVSEKRSVPVSILDGLNTMRLLERLQARLR